MKQNKTKETTVGIVLPFINWRGTEKQALRLGEGFIKNGFKVILFNVQGWGKSEPFHRTGIKVVNVGHPLHNLNEAGKEYPSGVRVFRLAYLAWKYKCDLLLCRAGMAKKICGWAAKLAGIPAVVVFSSVVRRREIEKRSPLQRKLDLFRFLADIGFADYFVTVSSVGGDNLRFSFPSLADRVFAINNGIDLNELDVKSPIPVGIAKTNRFRLCYTGTVELKRKGLDTLIDSLDILVHTKKQTEIELLIVGSGPDDEEFRDLVAQKGIEDNVLYAGEQENPYSFMKSADLFILPSRKEGMPNALLEAMALGVCSIATDCPTGPKEIIENGKNGILVPVDGKDQLVDAILKLKKDPELRKKLAAEGMRTVQTKFSYQRMVEGYVKLIRKVVSKK